MSQPEYLLLTATEPDRSGLVAELTGFIAECGCNVEDSRVVVLGGYAGLMVLVSGEPAELEALRAGLPDLGSRTGIQLAPRRVVARRTPAGGQVPRFEVEGHALDHEGIIHALAETVRLHGGNILELESTTEAAPMSGEPLFTLKMSVWGPDSEAERDSLWRELDRVAHEEGVELVIRRARQSEGAAAVGPERRSVDRSGG
jgi:glycine cleavage system transcriptional repressor